jgi:hypothetical protein
MYNPAQYWDVLLTGNMQGQVILNHFWYGSDEEGLPYGGPPSDVADDFIAIVLPVLLLVTVNTVTYTAVDVTEHNSGTAVATVSLTSANTGGRGGDALPSFNAWGFRSQRYSSSVPRAHKRFAGVSEADQNAGIINPAIVDDMNDVANILGAIFDVSNGGSTDMVPLQISRRDNSVTPHVDRPVPLFEPALNWAYQKLTSQASRRA